MAACKIIPVPGLFTEGYRLLGKTRTNKHYDGKEAFTLYSIRPPNYRHLVNLVYTIWAKPSNGYYELARKI